jgi:uncharacterized protein (TIGR03437 family)
MGALGRTDGSGNTYFTGTYLGSPTGSVFRVNDDGSFAPRYGSTASPLHLLGASSLAMDASGVAWVVGGGLVNAAGQFGWGRQDSGYSGDGGRRQEARFNSTFVTLGPGGDIYLIDSGRIRRLTGLTPPKVPAIAANGIVNAVTCGAGPIAPGELVSIFGSNFGTDTLEAAAPENNRIALALGRTKVWFDGFSGAITAVTPTQINAFVPNFLSPGETARVVVQVDATVSEPASVSVAKTAPGIAPVVVNQDGSINSPGSAAAAGSVVTLFGTGSGSALPLLVWGYYSISTPYSLPVEPVTVSVAGRMADLIYAGAAPLQTAGVLQVNLHLPAGLAAGAWPVVVFSGRRSSARDHSDGSINLA